MYRVTAMCRCVRSSFLLAGACLALVLVAAPRTGVAGMPEASAVRSHLGAPSGVCAVLGEGAGPLAVDLARGEGVSFDGVMADMDTLIEQKAQEREGGNA